jgi:hypothetical protein
MDHLAYNTRKQFESLIDLVAADIDSVAADPVGLFLTVLSDLGPCVANDD